jgi:two-component system, OmpR family, sensor histidine kinase VicK
LTVLSFRSIKGKREITRVFYGVETVINTVIQFVSQTSDVVYAYVDQTRPVLALDILVLKRAFVDAKKRGVRLMYVTEITKDNLSYCKQLLEIVSELRHLDGIKGNFYVSETAYLAPATLHEKGKPASQIIYSNVNEIIEHQSYVFESFWNRAIPAQQKIREIEEGKKLQESKILYGVENAAKIQSQIISNAKSKIDACLDSNSASVIVKSQSIKKIMLDAINNRGIEYRYITEINKDNIHDCRELIKIFPNMRHLEEIKTDFIVSDEEYASIAIMQQAQIIPEVIYSTVKRVVEQQRFLFQTLWSKATPVERRIREIEEGIDLGHTEIIQSPQSVSDLLIDIVKLANQEVLVIIPTINAFLRNERIGIIQLLEHKALKGGVNVRILTPTNDMIEKTIQDMVALVSEPEKEELNKNFNIRSHVVTFERTTVTTVTVVIVDKRELLAIEQINDSKGELIETIGLATYSNSQPTVMSYASIFESLWRQSKLYGQLREANEQLKVHDKMQKEFINIASHEIRTPTQAIIGLSDVIQSHPEKSDEIIQGIRRNATRLQRLTNDILDVTRIESQTLQLDKELFNLNELISNILEDYKNQVNNTMVQLVYKNTKMENGSSSIFVEGDKYRLSQVIFNILDNAIKFTKEGTISISTKKRTKGGGDDVTTENTDKQKQEVQEAVVTLEDTGTGIHSEILSRLFSKFATKSHVGGTGLGLFISRSIVEAHGGIIIGENYASNGKKGARFIFTIPLNNHSSRTNMK